MSENIVEMNNITKRFPGIVANDNVSIQIRKGEIYALLGENGAGKSTLMSILFGMYEPDEGEIRIRGKKERIYSPAYAASLSIGMVHQHFTLVSNYTVTENIILGAETVKKFGFIKYVDKSSDRTRIAELSKKYGLQVDPDSVIENLPVSIHQRVEILKMLYRGAEILIFDEPTALLTPQEIDSLLQIIRNLRDGGKTIILISHKLDEIKQVADRCAVLNRGKLIGVYDVASTSTSDMARFMVGHDVTFTTEKTPCKPGAVVLDVKNLSVRNEEDVERVHEVSFSVRSGEIFAVAGVAGNGQEEIADCIAGLVSSSGGTITLNGADITTCSIRRRAEAGISYIPEDRQNYGLVMGFDIKSNLALKNYYRKPFSSGGILNQDAFEENGDRLRKEYDIRSAEQNATRVSSMSGGNQQKVIIAREVSLAESNGVKTPLLIFVQPTRGLDVGAIESIRKQIVACRDKGAAILLISLELDEIMDLADTIGIIYNGRLSKIAPAQELTVNQIGEYMMGVAK